MPTTKLEEDTASIVLLGSFNPAIFQPAWLAAKGLIRESERDTAAIDVVHPDLTSFRAEWLTLSVTRDRFVAMTSDAAQHAPLRDLVIGIFELLEHTPTTKLGLNRSMQYRLPDEPAWHALGHLIAPKEPWDGVVAKPGMLSVSMLGARDDGLSGRLVMKVEPSVKYLPNGAFVDVNNELHALATGDATSYFISLLRDHWDRIIRDAGERAMRLISKATGETT